MSAHEHACEYCGKVASYYCDQCGAAVCSDCSHVLIGSDLNVTSVTCVNCYDDSDE